MTITRETFAGAAQFKGFFRVGGVDSAGMTGAGITVLRVFTALRALPIGGGFTVGNGDECSDYTHRVGDFHETFLFAALDYTHGFGFFNLGVNPIGLWPSFW